MSSDDLAVTAAYLDHLGDNDVALIAAPEHRGLPAGTLRGLMRNRRGGIEDRLGDPAVYRVVFGPGVEDDPIVRVSPFLVFAVAVQRAVQEIGSASYVPEWAGIGRRTPVFDVDRLRRFLEDPWVPLFLTELLASFTHVASGSILVAGRRGLRRRRFSELDPVLLAGMLDVVPRAERPGVLRRLGDLALFLTGVFPDHVARRGFSTIEEGRLLRAGRVGHDQPAPERGAAGTGSAQADESAVALLESLGRRWYRAAGELAPRPLPANLAVISVLPEHFSDARRVLALVTERVLFPYRDRWFGAGRV